MNELGIGLGEWEIKTHNQNEKHCKIDIVPGLNTTDIDEQALLCPLTEMCILIGKDGNIVPESLKNFDFDLEAEISLMAGSYILKQKEMKKKKSEFKIYLEHDINSANFVSFNLHTRGNVGRNSENDELGFATNWTRAFKKIFTMIKWLNAFAIINEIAANKILKKFIKEHFQIKDNIVDKNIMRMLENFAFVKRSNI